MQPDALLDRIHEVAKYDEMARRTFGLGDSSGMPGSLSVNILTSQQAFVQISEQ